VIITDRWKEPTSGRLYTLTGREPPEVGEDFEGKEYAYWMLASQIKERLGEEPATMRDIYYQVGVPLGLSSSNVVVLVKGAVQKGYLE